MPRTGCAARGLQKSRLWCALGLDGASSLVSLSSQSQGGFAGMHWWVLHGKVRMSPSEESNSSGHTPASVHSTCSKKLPMFFLTSGLVGRCWVLPKELSFYRTPEWSHRTLQQTEREARPGVGGLLPSPQAGCHHLSRDEPDPDFPKAKLRDSRKTPVSLQPEVSWSKNEASSPSRSDTPLLSCVWGHPPALSTCMTHWGAAPCNGFSSTAGHRSLFRRTGGGRC